MSTLSTTLPHVNGTSLNGSPANRIARLNGKVAPKAKSAARPKQAFATGKDHLQVWCYVYIGLAATFSAYLNGWANAQHAPEGMAWAAWACGVAIPALVLILGRIAGLLYKRQLKGLSIAAAVVASTLLFLSVWHCSVSIAMLTGSNMPLAIAFAVGIDCGLLTSEVASLMK